MRFERRYTQAGKSPFAGMAFRAADSEIRNPDGSIVFQLKNVDVPADWSQVASDVLAQKYFRRAGVPARLIRVRDDDLPEFLWRSVPDEAALAAMPEADRFGSETSSRQVFHRMAGAWTYGDGRAATSTAKRMRAPSMTSIASCLPPRSAHPTRRNGSTPVCTGPMASTVPVRAIGSWAMKTARRIRPPRPTSGRSPMPVSSRVFPTIW